MYYDGLKEITVKAFEALLMNIFFVYNVVISYCTVTYEENKKEELAECNIIAPNGSVYDTKWMSDEEMKDMIRSSSKWDYVRTGNYKEIDRIVTRSERKMVYTITCKKRATLRQFIDSLYYLRKGMATYNHRIENIDGNSFCLSEATFDTYRLSTTVDLSKYQHIERRILAKWAESSHNVTERDVDFVVGDSDFIDEDQPW